MEGSGSIEGKVWVFPRVRILLYKLIGPSFDFKPYLSTTLSGGFKEELLGQTNDFCAWSFDCSTGLDIAGGLSIMHPIFSGYEIQNYSTPNVPFINIPLYHSPKRIQKVSLTGSGQTKTANFNVYDQNYLFNTEVLTPLWQFVKFEANGQLSSEYGIAHNGQVAVNWTPSGNDILYAKLYDINGNVMSWDTIHVPQEPQGDWVDLGLPSGLLWATCNIGAENPEDYGDYFAWGEITTKETYDWSTYQYCMDTYYTLTKYCNDSYYGYNGFTDNLTTLLPEDDAATANWGSDWRMPTRAEWQELLDNTTVTWTTQNGVNGRLFTASNGNSLFLPAAGCRYYSGLNGVGSYGGYWSSSLDTDGPNYAWYFEFGSFYDGVGSTYRSYGFSVRPVRSSQN